MTQHDPNQRIVILILGAALLAGVTGLLAAAYKGAPIDVAVVGIVMSIAGAFTGYLNRPATPPPPQAPGTTDVKSTAKEGEPSPKITIEAGDKAAERAESESKGTKQ